MTVPISRRDYFAAQAMNALIIASVSAHEGFSSYERALEDGVFNPDPANMNSYRNLIAEDAFQIADAMINVDEGLFT